MARDIAKLAGMGNAASVNIGGGVGPSKDKLLYLDPNEEIFYDPKKNIRNHKALVRHRERLIALRVTIDNEGQIQPIKVYLLPPEMLDPKRPKMKYGICVGHRRTLASRLTSADSELILTSTPRKVTALLETDWINRGESRQIEGQFVENEEQEPLNFVEKGEGLRKWQEAVYRETGKRPSQREMLQKWPRYKEKTLGYLMQAAEFDDLAKEACHESVISDLDSLVTFDAVCKAHPEFAQAMYKSLEDPEAPRTRALIRAAKTLVEANPEYIVDHAAWAWPDVVQEIAKPKPAPVEPAQPQQTVGQQPNVAAAPVAPVTPAGPASTETPASAGVKGASNDGAENSGNNASNVVDLPFKQPSHTGGEDGVNTQTGKQTPAPIEGAGNAAESGQKGAQASNVAPQPQSKAPQPVVMVSFKMGDEATQEFNGELVLGKRAKTASMGVVAYLNEGREETIEVPLKHINLLSINHH